MRGRTNISGNGNNIFVDGNIIEGVVADPDGIVSGDFVQKKFTSKKIQSTVLAGYLENREIISNVFTLTDGTFCVFFSESGNSLNDKLYLWKYKIEDDEMVDLGCFKIPFYQGGDLYSKNDAFFKISENKFLYLFLKKGTRVANGKNIYYVKFVFLKITIIEDQILVEVEEHKLDDSENVYSYDIASGFFRCFELENRNYIINLFSQIYEEGIGRYGSIYLLFSVSKNEEIRFNAENILVDKDKEYNNAINHTSDIIFPYEDGKTFIGLKETNIRLFDYENNIIRLIRRDVMLGVNYESSFYLGNNKTLIIQDVSDYIVTGKVLTYNNEVYGLSGEVEIGSIPSYMYPSSAYVDIKIKKAKNKEFVVVNYYYTSSYTKTNSCMIGILINKNMRCI